VKKKIAGKCSRFYLKEDLSLDFIKGFLGKADFDI